MKSMRQELLSQEARDILKAAFEKGLLNNSLGGFQCNAVEVRLDDPIKNILDGGDGFMAHGLAQSERYFKHIADENWAVVFDSDCDGDCKKGWSLLKEVMGS